MPVYGPGRVLTKPRRITAGTIWDNDLRSPTHQHEPGGDRYRPRHVRAFEERKRAVTDTNLATELERLRPITPSCADAG